MSGPSVTFDDTSSTLKITGYDSTSEAVYDSYKNTAKHLIIENILTISERAFYQWKLLEIIKLVDVKTIDDQAFYSCTSLASIELPNVETIGSFCFSYCDSLASIELPKATTFKSYAFYFCNSLTSIKLPEVTTIGSNAFAYCDSLTSVDMPKVETIEDSAFSSCKIKQVHLGSSLKSIYGDSFQRCSSLERFIVEESNQNFANTSDGVLLSKDMKTLRLFPGNYSFPKDKKGIYEVPEYIEVIGSSAFYFYSTLLSIDLKNVTTIKNSAFMYCTSLASVKSPKLETIELNAFYYCKKLISIEFMNVKLIGNSALSYCGLLSVDLPKVEELQYYTFHDSQIIVAKIGNNLKTIYGNPFSGCSKLERIIVDTNNENFMSTSDGVLLSKDMKTLLGFPGNYCFPLERQGHYKVPEEVEVIGLTAFEKCSNLKIVDTTNTITIVGYSFDSCSSLESIEFCKVQNIEWYAFRDCTKLSTIFYYGVNEPKINSSSFSLSGATVNVCHAYQSETFGPYNVVRVESEKCPIYTNDFSFKRKKKNSKVIFLILIANSFSCYSP